MSDVPDPTAAPGPTSAELLSVLAHDMAVLMRAELELNQAEHAVERRERAVEIAALLGGGLALMLAAAAATAAAIEGLQHWFSNWLAALIVAGAWTAAAALLFEAGKLERIRHRFDPEGDAQRLADAQVRCAAAEASVRLAAARLAETARAEAMDSIAERTIGVAEREGELLLRELVSLLRSPGRAGIGVLGKLAGR